MAIGEVTHGTKQADQLQVKIAMDLCRHHGFSVVVLGEVYTASTLALNQYVLFGEGTLEEALQQIADKQGVVTNETKALANWIHDENKTRPIEQRIWLVGAEVAPLNLLADALFRHHGFQRSIQPTNELYTIAQTPSHLISLNFGPDPATFLGQAFAQSTHVMQEQITQQLSLEQRWQRQITSQYPYAIDIFVRNREAVRETGIFENIKWLRDHLLNPKIVIIDAHNGHVERQQCYNSDIASFRSIKRFGHFLHEAYPTEYFVVGTELQRGYFNRGFDKQVNRVPEHKWKIGTILGQQTESDYGLVDMKKCRALALLPHTNYRMTYGTSNQMEGSVARCSKVTEAFDALIFIRESQPSIILDSIISRPVLSVYLNMNQQFIDSVTASGRLTISLSDLRFTPTLNKRPELRLQIYIHDRKQRFLKLTNFQLQATDSTLFIIPLLPTSAKLISISIVGKNIHRCQVGKITINNHVISALEFLLLDPKSYKLTVQSKDGFTVDSQEHQ